jgi:alpha-N-acetylglucosamine transferase
LYTEYQHHVGVLSHLDGQQVKWYQNEYYPGGNSYYREIGHPENLFPIDKFIIKKTRSLDSVCIENNFELPDLIKIDVQGSEMDIIKGASKCLEKAKYLIVEMQHVDYNENAPKVFETKPFIESLGWKCIAEKFSDNGCDADYCFVKEL